MAFAQLLAHPLESALTMAVTLVTLVTLTALMAVGIGGALVLFWLPLI
jgi:hypothetical protein